MHYSSSADNATLPSQLIPDSFVLPFVSSMEENMIHIKHQMEDNLLPTQNMCQGSNINLPTQEGTTVTCIQEDSIMDCNGIDICQGMSFKGEASAYCSITGNSSSDAKNGAFADNASRQSLPSLQSFRSSKNEEVCMKDEREDELLVSNSIFCHSVKVLKEDTNDHNSSVSGDAGADNVHNSDAGADNVPSVYNDSRQLLPGVQPFTSIKSQSVCIKEERENILIPSEYMVHHSLKAIGEAAQSSRIGHRYHVDDDADICILEDISDPIRSTPFVAHAKPSVTATHSMYSDSIHHTGFGSPGRKANDERLTFRVALQDLAQPKSEASPPDGVLAVPLLRHQRIALSWMVQKETASVPCSGGILADDQGLGKTVSTIALILKERSPSSKMNSVVAKQGELESLNLDEDDDGVLDVDGVKQDKDSGLTKKVAKGENASMVTKGRPAAGTLIVCPTSVLRQWADELHNKVTKEANLSFLVYHGTNRTKDPYDLAKYDVVLTTYSIVSMEVPKQPLVDKDDDEKGKAETHGLPSMDLSSSRKRKYPPSSDKKTQNVKKGVDGALLESVSRPLARVGWFRVVLDEAQSIKNYRTQVARACWGLRAKRRWCLSGTPIQNAVDDLYSYFRFLRYDPYAVYKSFCSMIKIPINKNPTHGYKKLQAVLKTIMLRRTKGTIIDGKPIITLPLKSIELKKVDFSKEEWDFYSKLEADSRAKFKVYEDAGTVKENYVNILLMLLRLRQACDHPLLVKGYDSSSVWSSSIETAKKLPREKKLDLLNCLEALAICGICNDPPEDAVVTICSHVFCNQCICERLSSDDNLCPAADCKVKLSVTSVFSKATLKCSLSDQSGQGNSNSNFASKLVQTFEPCPEGLSSDSSKIKAALEVLKTLSKPLECTPRDNTSHSSNQSTNCAENGSDSHSDCSFKDSPDKAKVAEKAIVFSQWTRMLDLLEARLKSSSIQYRRLDGTMSIVARDKAVKDFNSLPEVSVMIMSLKAASLGLNMVAACRVLLLDLWWNPTTEDQAIDRAHRIGQTRPVTVLRLTVKDTVEDRILALQQKKREMVASAFGEDETGSCQTRLTVEDLKYLFMV
ncbi:PREDICTED: helicase-like transcription factor CHR28 isoform X1 [Nelumbo nucifera]|nr:PREDICTED: helicase-like transcription factor CHR28 isoform X1 [Nelumbo nucifera]